MKSVLVKGMGVVIFSLLLTTVILEIVMRIAGYTAWSPVPIEDDVTYLPRSPIVLDTTLGYKMLPGEFKITYNKEFVFTITHNRNGYRITSPDTITKANSTKRRINIFGDSFTHGSGLNDTQTYPWLLQQKLPDWQVNNYGISGYGIANVLTQIEKYFPPHKGDIYIYSYFTQHNNRYERTVLKMIYAQPKLMGMLGYLTLNSNLATTFHAYDYKMFTLSRYSALINFLEDKWDGYLDKRDNFEAMAVAQKAINYLNNKCKKAGAILVIAGIRQHDGTAKMLNYCNEQKILSTDISVDLTNNKFNQMPFDDHPNSYSNILFANRLNKFLIDKNLLSKLK